MFSQPELPREGRALAMGRGRLRVVSGYLAQEHLRGRTGCKSALHGPGTWRGAGLRKAQVVCGKGTILPGSLDPALLSSQHCSQVASLTEHPDISQL